MQVKVCGEEQWGCTSRFLQPLAGPPTHCHQPILLLSSWITSCSHLCHACPVEQERGITAFWRRHNFTGGLVVKPFLIQMHKCGCMLRRLLDYKQCKRRRRRQKSASNSLSFRIWKVEQTNGDRYLCSNKLFKLAPWIYSYVKLSLAISWRVRDS